MHTTPIADLPPSPPVELARRLHDTVAQRLAGLSYLLSSERFVRADALIRCRTEVDAALDELREALATATSGVWADEDADVMSELQALRSRFRDVEIRCDLEDVLDMASNRLVGAFLVEALRNIGKHAVPSAVAVEIHRELDVTSIVVVNDGVAARRGPSSGLGHRLLQIEASLCGGLVESTPLGTGAWRQRLILPAAVQCAD